MSDVINRGQLRSPLETQAQSAGNQWAGRTTLNSGSATVTVSTFTVGSDSILLLGVEAPTAQNSGFGAAVEVRSISPGNFFTLGYSDGNARARDATVNWLLVKTS